MRALPSLASPVLLLTISVILMTCCGDQLGYYPDEPYFDETSGVVEDLSAVCPSEEVYRVRDQCDAGGNTIECIRKRCCHNYTHIAGRCIPDNVDPCSLLLCEQACKIQDDSVWCSCHPGYRFSADNFMRKSQPFCVDINECESNNGGCQQVCMNDPGTFHCACTSPYTLNDDGVTCNLPTLPVMASFQILPLPLTRASSRCYAPCNTVSWLSKKVEKLSDQLAIMQKNFKKLLKHSNSVINDAAGNEPMPYKVLDATAPILEGGFCRCERGPMGRTGPPGKEGPKGEEGPRGQQGPKGQCESTDLLLLLLADLRHDIMNIEAAVFRDGYRPARLDLEKWEQEHKIKRKREDYEQNLEATPLSGLEYYVETDEVTPNGLHGSLLIKEPHTTTSSTNTDDTSSPALSVTLSLIEEQLKKLRLLARTTDASDESDDDGSDEDGEDYNFY